MTAIFISHSSADNAAAAEMKRWLEAQGHTSLFLDFDPEAGIKGGSGWEQTLYQQLRQCQAVIALLTPNWLASKWCFAELVQARERGKAIFPVKVQPCEAGGLFSDIQHIDLVAQPEEGYRRLKVGLLERGLDPLDIFAWDPKRPPYPGLLAFQEADAAIFFGRGEEILKTLETMDTLRRQGRDAARFVLLLGASGSGKSSLARAGVIPRLRKKPFEWLPVPPFRPQIEPLDELAMAIAAALESHGRPRDWSALRSELQTAAEQSPMVGLALLGLARELAIAAQQPEATVLITIDQAEELFGYSLPEAATRFLRLLRAALEAGDQRLMVVATLRSDFLGDFQNHAALQDGEYPHHLRYQAVPVNPMPVRNFPVIIQGPARLAGVQLDDGLVEAMVTDAGARDALPLLAFTLRRLYERYGGDGRLSVSEYEAIGRLEGAVREEAQRVITEADPSSEDLEALHAAFVPTMVRINAEGAYARRRAFFDDLPRRAVPLLQRFVDARLLVTDRDPQGHETIEVAHEALLRTWPQLGGWLAEDRDKLRLLDRIQRSSEEWDQGGRRDDLLVHRNGRLKDAEALQANPRFTVPEASVERTYLEACSTAQQAREAAEKEEQEQRIRDAERIAEEQKKAAEAQKKIVHRTRIGLVAILLVAALATVAAWFAYNGEQKARKRLRAAQITESRFLADRARQEADRGHARLSILLALEALPADIGDDNARPYVVEAEAALYHALQQPYDQSVMKSDGVVLAAAFSPDGTRAATLSSNGTLRVWDAASGEPIRTLREGPTNFSASEGVSVTFNQDGNRILSKWKRTATLWDPVAGKQVASLGDGIYSAAFSPDGRRVVTGNGFGNVQVWDAANGIKLRDRQRHKHWVVSVAFSPDGNHIVSASTEDRTVRLFNAETDGELAVLDLQGYSVQSAVFDGDGRHVAIAGHELVSGNGGQAVGRQVVLLWDTDSPDKFDVFRQQKPLGTLLAFSPDGSRIVAAGENNTAILVHIASHRETLLSGHDSTVRLAAFSSDGKRIITASDDATARLYDISGTELATLRGHDGSVQSATLGSDGEHIITSDFGAARLWTVSRAIQVSTLRRDKEQCRAVAFSPDAKHAVTACSDGVHLWDVAGGKYFASLPGYAAETWFAAFSPKGDRILSGSSDGDVRIWDAAIPKALAVISGKSGHPYAVEFSRDETRLLSAIWNADTTSTIREWDASSLSPILTVSGLTRRGRSARFSPDGTRVIIFSDDEPVRLEDLGDRNRPVIELGSNDKVRTAQFSPDGRLVAAGLDDGSVQLWDVHGGKPIASWPVHTGWVLSLAFSRDGSRIVTGSMDWTAHLSDTTLHKSTVVLAGHQERVWDAAFNADAGRIGTTSGDATIRLWDGVTGKELVVLDTRHWFKRPPEIRKISLAADNRTIATLDSDGVARLWHVFPSTQALIEYARTIVRNQQLTDSERLRFFLDNRSGR